MPVSLAAAALPSTCVADQLQHRGVKVCSPKKIFSLELQVVKHAVNHLQAHICAVCMHTANSSLHMCRQHGSQQLSAVCETKVGADTEGRH